MLACLLGCFASRGGSSAAGAASGIDPTLAAAAQALAISFAPGDSADSVTKDVGLAETLPHGVSVAWASSAPTLVAPTGSVQLPSAGTAEVVLTATLTLAEPLLTNPPALDGPRRLAHLTKLFRVRMASLLETRTTTELVQATGGAEQSQAGTVQSLVMVGDPVAATGSKNATGSVTIVHGYQPPN